MSQPRRRPPPPPGFKRYPVLVDGQGEIVHIDSCSLIWVDVNEEREWPNVLKSIGYLDKALERYEAVWLSRALREGLGDWENQEGR